MRKRCESADTIKTDITLHVDITDGVMLLIEALWYEESNLAR